MWPFKKKEKKEVIFSNTLFLFMRDQSNPFSIVDHPWTGGTNKRSIVKPWKPFYKWFFSSNKEYFIIPIDKGLMTIRRSQLLTFKIVISEQKD